MHQHAEKQNRKQIYPDDACVFRTMYTVLKVLHRIATQVRLWCVIRGVLSNLGHRRNPPLGRLTCFRPIHTCQDFWDAH
jgi:hypothetical protein